MIIEKFSNFRNEYLDFIKELDDADFSDIKKASEIITESSDGDIKQEAQQLKVFLEQFVAVVKGKKEENLKEKSAVSERKLKLPITSVYSINVDVSNYIKKLIEKKQSFFESECIQLTNKFKKPVIGTLWKETEGWLNQITETDFEKGKRSHEILLSISKFTIDDVLGKLKKSLDEFAEKNIDQFEKQTIILHEEIKAYLESRFIYGYEIPDKISFDYTIKYDELIMTCLRIDEPYKGKFLKPNFRSTILEIRYFYIIFVLLLGMLGINRNTFGKDEEITIYFSLFTFIIIYVGVLYTIKKIQDTKIEKMEEELVKARESIAKGIKKVVDEFFIEWSTFIKTNFKTVMTDISLETEQLIKNDANNKAEKITDEKLQLDELIRAIDVREKFYTNLLKIKCPNWEHKMKQLEYEIELSSQKNKLI